MKPRPAAGAVAAAGPVHVPLPEPDATGRLSLDACYRYCEAVARANHENFPVASRFLPSRLRPHVLALYAFARAADDFADEPEYAGRRGESLDTWEDELRLAYHGTARHPVFVALADTVEKFEIPIQAFEEILAAFRLDLTERRFATWRDLIGYASLAAKPIGRALLYVYGYRDPERHRYGEELSVALALTNFWQDVTADLERDRIYLPQEDLRYFGVSEGALVAREQTKELASLLRYECARTRAIYERARPLVRTVRDDLGVEVALMWHGGSIALGKIEASADHYFRRRPALTVADKGLALGRALAERGTGLLSRI